MREKLLIVLAILLLLPAGACKGHRPGGAASNASTETIAPPAPKPDLTGTDAMTQTVDIEDSRSEDDGGVLTSAQTAKVPGAATPTATTTKNTAKKKTKK